MIARMQGWLVENIVTEASDGASLIVAEFTISVSGSSCNSVSFSLLLSVLYLFLCVLKAGWGDANKKKGTVKKQ